MYQESDIVRIAKRENNTKRNYLVVNRLQGKHVPVSAVNAFAMFDALAEVVRQAYSEEVSKNSVNEQFLFIGFAETATAIGARLACKLNGLYMQTTRETIADVEYLYFTESHSHATEQKLVKNDMDTVIDKVNRIVFVEDEVTTGNTILNIVNLIRKTYGDKVSFSVASILNGMDEEALLRYEQNAIKVHYLVKTNHDSYIERASKFSENGNMYHRDEIDRKAYHKLQEKGAILSYDFNGYLNPRRCIKALDMQRACENIYEQILSIETMQEEDVPMDKNRNQSILVLGTEECMYPAIYVAEQFEKQGFEVKTHSTTRSPIMTSSEEDYPLHERYELASLYDANRVTYLYNLTKYDKVWILTDADSRQKEGLDSLLSVLVWKGNTDIRRGILS